ncbi:MAG: nuclear transport factor 2 family protein, partial [Candidatus Hodarchaeota archaeon]
MTILDNRETYNFHGKEDSTEDIEQIAETLRNYSEAFKEWNWEKLANAFHPAVTISYVEDGEFISKQPYLIWKESFPRYQQEDPGIKYEIELNQVDRSDSVAFARMKWLIDSPTEIQDTIDYLILLKFDKKWLIV